MIKKLILPILAVALTSLSIAQGFGGGGRQGGMMGRMGGSPHMLLNREDVKEDIGLSTDQSTKISEIQSSMRTKMQEFFQNSGIDMAEMRTAEGREKMQKMMLPIMEGINKEIDGVLTAPQKERLLEIFVQISKNNAISYEPVAKSLGITDEQKSAIASLRQKQAEAMRSLFEMMQNGELDREGMQEKMKKNNDILDAEIGKLLTKDQAAMLVKMGGTKKFVPKDN